ncbi:MAG TPA: methyltransferase domain-containing protein [Aggregatilineales bacterium]|nr:methyltransferase domain-containing protein [Aggregatilineales bacterium]
MSCCRQCEGLENVFDDGTAKSDLESYRREGPAKTTRLLLDHLRGAGVDGLTLLDIGGGVGAIQHELVASGVRATVDVDASRAYLAAARSEAARRGYADRAQYHHGNFVELAPHIEAADIVTLDRVICCFPDMPGMVRHSAERAKRFYGLIYPRDTWYTRTADRIGNAFLSLIRNKYHFFVHPAAEVDALVQGQGLKLRYHRNASFFWQVLVYER